MSQADPTPMDAEFDTVARWTETVVQQLGADYGVPAACRGSASPAALRWLGTACRLAEGSRLADIGGGMGGPAAFAAQEYGASPTVVEPMLGACRAVRRLFGLPVVAGNGEQLPLATGSADAVWCLGVLCTTPEKAQLIAEATRVLRPGAPLGLLVFLARSVVRDAPDGNSFPTADELAGLLDGAGFRVDDAVCLADLPGAPRWWQERIERVEAALATAHADDPRLAQAQEQEQRIAALLSAGQVTGRLLVARATGRSSSS